MNMPGIRQISDKLADKVQSLLKRLRGSKHSKKNKALVPDGAYALDQLPALTGVGFKELEGFVKKGDLIGYKFSKNNQTYVLKENLDAFLHYLQKNFNYVDYKWQKGYVNID